jgi:UrcA family protein
VSNLRPTLLIAAAASAFCLFAAPAIAQDYYDDEIIVRAPTVEREYTGRRSSIGAPINELTLQRSISTADLDLRHDGDVRELYRRIDRVAFEACSEVERASRGVPLTTRRDCIREATNDAMAQADGLIYTARG